MRPQERIEELERFTAASSISGNRELGKVPAN